MSLTAKTSPLSDELVNAWIQSFDPLELQKMGWTPESLNEAFRDKEVVYNVSPVGSPGQGGGSLASVILFHHIDQTTDEILFLATPPALRGKGLMWDLLEAFAARKGSIQIWLECREDNQPAIDLYRKIGFKESGRRERYYKDGTAAILFNF